MDAALCALQVVDTDLDRCESNRWSRLDPDDGEDMESDEPSYTDQQLYMPLRQVLASLRRLHRLRLRGASPFGFALAELPPLRVRHSAPYQCARWKPD